MSKITIKSDYSIERTKELIDQSLVESKTAGFTKRGVTGKMNGSDISLKTTGRIVRTMCQPNFVGKLDVVNGETMITGSFKVSTSEKIITALWFLWCAYMAVEGNILVSIVFAGLYSLFLLFGWFMSLGEESEIEQLLTSIVQN